MLSRRNDYDKTRREVEANIAIPTTKKEYDIAHHVRAKRRSAIAHFQTMVLIPKRPSDPHLMYLLLCLCCRMSEVEVSNESEDGPHLESEEFVLSRHNNNARHEEGIKHITPELRDAAHQANPVDNALHEFVSAKFCRCLQETGLLQHPLVLEELVTFELLHERWD